MTETGKCQFNVKKTIKISINGQKKYMLLIIVRKKNSICHYLTKKNTSEAKKNINIRHVKLK